MSRHPIHMLLLGILSLAACDEERQDTLGTPDATEAGRPERPSPGDATRRDEVARPGEPSRPGDLAKPPDNTAQNKGEAADLTPFDQSENPADIKITADIRKAVLGADGLSANADNVKIITSNGVVAVRGVVENQSEIDTITRIVNETPGVASADIQLTVDPD